MQKLISSVLFVLFVVASIDAQRGGGGGRPGRGPIGRRPGGGGRPGAGGPPIIAALKDADKYTWDVDASPGALIPQKAFVLPDKDIVALVTFSKDLRDLNMTSSIILMNTATNTMTIKGRFRRGPCFMTDLSATKLEIESDFSAWNDTTITMAYSEALNGTNAPLSREETLAIFQADPSLARFCRGARLIQTTPMLAGEEDPDTKTLTFFGYDSQVSLMVPGNIGSRLPGRRGQGRGEGRRPGGGRGRGQRRNGDGGQDQDQGQGPRGPFGRRGGRGGRGRGDGSLNL